MSEEEQPKYQFPILLGHYQLIDLIGVGGMGEVFLAEDLVCQRRVALKRILPAHLHKPRHYERFLLEPKITAQLTHPSIVPVYSLHVEANDIYYTMPYVEGEDLSTILCKAHCARELGLIPQLTGSSSVYTLMLMFFNICQAIYYVHSKGFLHQDINPNNIRVKNLTQVTILDWGCAIPIGAAEKHAQHIKTHEMPSEGCTTRPMSPVGTLNYMAPERAFLHPNSVQTDIYSLGATLYYILTLERLFDRPDDPTQWREQLHSEGVEPVPDPQSVAPEREIPPRLSRIVFKCLDAPSRRYTSVKEIIADLNDYIRGQPEWTLSGKFQLDHLSDWEFQENMLLTKHMAISRAAGVMEWAMLMLSKRSYSENIQLRAQVTLKQGCHGMGFLMCASEKRSSHILESGYLIWIGSEENRGCKFLYLNIEIIDKEHIYLEFDREYTIIVQRQGNQLSLFINNECVITHAHYTPLSGGYVGLLLRDVDLNMSPVYLYVGSQNITVNCLAIPDAFLQIKDYNKALGEYRRIACSFRGRSEGREATFRAGITLIEMGKNDKTQAKNYFNTALKEFEKLHKTAGAPLEYLGKSLVYQEENNLEEETKCLELAVRMYPKHPLIRVIKEHIIFRFQEAAQTDRVGAYTFALLTVRYLPFIYERKVVQNCVKNLTVHWEDISFFEAPLCFSEKIFEHIYLSIRLAFWLVRPITLYELVQEIPKGGEEAIPLLENALLTLVTLGYPKLILFIFNVKLKNETDSKFLFLKNKIEILIEESPFLDKLDRLLPDTPTKFFIPLLKQNITIRNAKKLLPYFEKTSLPKTLHIWVLLLAERTQKAGKLLGQEEDRKNPSSLFYMLHGCFLARSEGEEAALAHFGKLVETIFPRIPALLGHFLNGHITVRSSWMKRAFLWEKLELYRQLALYYFCLNHTQKAQEYEKRVEEELIRSTNPFESHLKHYTLGEYE